MPFLRSCNISEWAIYCNRELRWNVDILGLCMLARCGPLLLSLSDSCIATLYAECTMTDGVQALGGNQFEQLMEVIRGTQMRFVERLEEFKGEVRQCQYRGYTPSVTREMKRRRVLTTGVGGECVGGARDGASRVPRHSTREDALEKGVSC